MGCLSMDTAAPHQLIDPDSFVSDKVRLSNVQSGTRAERKFIDWVIDYGWRDFSPADHDTSADVIIKKPTGESVAVQIKKGVYNKDRQTWKWKTGRVRSANDSGKRTEMPYLMGAFDVLCAWIDTREHGQSWVSKEWGNDVFIILTYKESQQAKSFSFDPKKSNWRHNNCETLSAIAFSKEESISKAGRWW